MPVADRGRSLTKRDQRDGRGDDRHSMPFIGEAEDELSILRSIDRGPGASGQKGVTMSDQRGEGVAKNCPPWYA